MTMCFTVDMFNPKCVKYTPFIKQGQRKQYLFSKNKRCCVIGSILGSFFDFFHVTTAASRAYILTSLDKRY